MLCAMRAPCAEYNNNNNNKKIKSNSAIVRPRPTRTLISCQAKLPTRGTVIPVCWRPRLCVQESSCSCPLCGHAAPLLHGWGRPARRGHCNASFRFYFFLSVLRPCTMMMCHPHCVLTGSRSQSPSLHVNAAFQKSGSSCASAGKEERERERQGIAARTRTGAGGGDSPQPGSSIPAGHARRPCPRSI